MADEPIVVPRPAAAPPPKPEEDFEAKAREYVKTRYGIEDEPDAWRTKHQEISTRAAEAERWQNTAQFLGRAVQAYQGRTAAQPQPQQPATPQADPNQLRELWRIDPYEGWSRAQAESEARIQSLLARHAQGIDRLTQERSQQQQAAQQWVNRQYEEYPESWDQNHDMHKLGRQIFSSWSPQRQAEPDASYMAARMAAAELGLAPRAKRRAPAEPVDREADSQNAERGSRRPSAASDEREPKLTAEEKKMAKAANIDPKVMAQMKRARQDKRNVRSEE